MKNNYFLNTYLEIIHEDFTTSYKQNLYKFLLQAIITIIFILIMVYLSSKKDRRLSDEISKITMKKYTVRIVNNNSPNAFCFGGIGNDIFITTGLINILTEKEIISVCLHESGHIINLDSIKSILVEAGVSGFEILLFNNILKIVGRSKDSKVLLMSQIILIVILISVGPSVPGILLGRLHEYRADKETVKYGYGKDLISALKKLQKWIDDYHKKDNKLKKLFNKISVFLDIHPKTKKRVDRLFLEIDLYKAMTEKNKEKIKNIVSKYILIDQ